MGLEKILQGSVTKVAEEFNNDNAIIQNTYFDLQCDYDCFLEPPTKFKEVFKGGNLGTREFSLMVTNVNINAITMPNEYALIGGEFTNIYTRLDQIQIDITILDKDNGLYKDMFLNFLRMASGSYQNETYFNDLRIIKKDKGDPTGRNIAMYYERFLLTTVSPSALDRANPSFTPLQLTFYARIKPLGLNNKSANPVVGAINKFKDSVKNDIGAIEKPISGITSSNFLSGGF